MATAERPTTVTFVNIHGGKKHQQTVYEGLRVLLDSGCSDYLLLARYVKKIKKKLIHIPHAEEVYQLSTKVTYIFHYQNLVIKKYYLEF